MFPSWLDIILLSNISPKIFFYSKIMPFYTISNYQKNYLIIAFEVALWFICMPYFFSIVHVRYCMVHIYNIYIYIYNIAHIGYYEQWIYYLIQSFFNLFYIMESLFFQLYWPMKDLTLCLALYFPIVISKLLFAFLIL